MKKINFCIQNNYVCIFNDRKLTRMSYKCTKTDNTDEKDRLEKQAATLISRFRYDRAMV